MLFDRNLLMTILASNGDALGFGAAHSVSQIGMNLCGFVAELGGHLLKEPKDPLR
jgi:hypothetical protein